MNTLTLKALQDAIKALGHRPEPMVFFMGKLSLEELLKQFPEIQKVSETHYRFGPNDIYITGFLEPDQYLGVPKSKMKLTEWKDY